MRVDLVMWAGVDNGRVSGCSAVHSRTEVTLRLRKGRVHAGAYIPRYICTCVTPSDAYIVDAQMRSGEFGVFVGCGFFLPKQPRNIPYLHAPGCCPHRRSVLDDIRYRLHEYVLLFYDMLIEY